MIGIPSRPGQLFWAASYRYRYTPEQAASRAVRLARECEDHTAAARELTETLTGEVCSTAGPIWGYSLGDALSNLCIRLRNNSIDLVSVAGPFDAAGLDKHYADADAAVVE
jgi:hypothetical protein